MVMIEITIGSLSKLSKQHIVLDLMAKSALTGLRNIIPTIIIGKMEIELPAMYIMNKFIGICLNGPRAMSQDF